MSASRLVLDIETRAASDADIEVAVNGYKTPANMRDTGKIAARREEAAAKIRERAALLDSSPIICLAAKTEHQAVLFNGMSNDAFPVEGWTVLPCGMERVMLDAFALWARSACDEHTILVGHNLMRFDLPMLRNHYIRNRLPLPAILDPGQPACDTMKMARYYSMENYDEIYISLDTVCASLGLPRKAPLLNGSDVPRLYSEGQYECIVRYNACDAALTEAAYLLMAGAGADEHR
jgi:hypothetical protein